MLGTECGKGAMGVIEVIHRTSQFTSPGEQVLEEPSDRLRLVEAEWVAERNAAEVLHCALAFGGGDDGGAVGAVQAEPLPEDGGAGLPLLRDGHAQPDHRGDVAPAAEEPDEAVISNAHELGIVGVDV